MFRARDGLLLNIISELDLMQVMSMELEEFHT